MVNEIGSEFHDLEIPEGSVLKITKGTYYATGRVALKQLLKIIPGFRGKVWLPAYFCDEVRLDLARRYCVKTYEDSPLLQQPEWDTLYAKRGDAVVIVNYFGLRSRIQCSEYLSEGVVVIEDHTHDPVSCWVGESDADYCIASLRKVLPVSDGAVLWSPKALPVPASDVSQCLVSAAQKKIAMSLKRDYLEQPVKSPSLKGVFRMLQVNGERQLGELEYEGISVWSKLLVEYGYPQKWVNMRKENYLQLLQGLKDFYPYDLGYLPTNLNHNTPLGLPLFLRSQAERDALRLWLNTHDIYCAVHWPSQNEQALGNTELTLPVDQRYTSSDMERILDILRAFFEADEGITT